MKTVPGRFDAVAISGGIAAAVAAIKQQDGHCGQKAAIGGNCSGCWSAQLAVRGQIDSPEYCC